MNAKAGSTVLVYVFFANTNCDFYSFQLPYGTEFSNGANFCIFRTHAICVKIRTYENFTRDYKITQFVLTQQLFVHYGAPDAPVNMVAS